MADTQPDNTTDDAWRRELARRAEHQRKHRFWWIEALAATVVIWGSSAAAYALFSAAGLCVVAVFWMIAIPTFNHVTGRGNC